MKKIHGKTRRGGCLFKLIKLFALFAVLLFVILYWGSSWIGSMFIGEYMKSMGLNGGVGAITINPITQAVDVRNFWIENPSNYSKGSAIAFDNAYIDLGVTPMEFFAKKVVDVDEIRIVGLNLAAELTISGLLSSPKSNLNEIISAFENKDETEKKEQAEEKQVTSTKNVEPMRFRIAKITFIDGKMRGGLNGRIVELPLPSFEYRNVGGEKGYTATELSVFLLSAIIPKATAELVQKLGAEGIDEGVKSIKSLFN